MNKKLLLLLGLLFFSANSIAKITIRDLPDWQVIECPKPTHSKGSPWQAPGWSLIKNGPDNDMTTVPDNVDVLREYEDYWFVDTIQCTYKFNATEELVLRIDTHHVRDNTYQQWSSGFRWSLGTCTTKASTPEVCHLYFLPVTSH